MAACRRYLHAHPTHTWSTARPSPDPCPASIISIDTATTEAECESIVGANCDASAPLESGRLLAHEQLHFDIACTLVGRANDALIAGTHTPAQLAAWLAANHQGRSRTPMTASPVPTMAAIRGARRHGPATSPVD